MQRTLAREVLVFFGAAVAALLLLLLARLVGVDFTAQIYTWFLAVLYSLRVLWWAARTVARPTAFR